MNPCAGATDSSLASTHWLLCLGAGNEPTAGCGSQKPRLTLAREVVKPVSAASLACPAKPAHRPSSRRCPRPTSRFRRSFRAGRWPLRKSGKRLGRPFRLGVCWRRRIDAGACRFPNCATRRWPSAYGRRLPSPFRRCKGRRENVPRGRLDRRFWAVENCTAWCFP